MLERSISTRYVLRVIVDRRKDVFIDRTNYSNTYSKMLGVPLLLTCLSYILSL